MASSFSLKAWLHQTGIVMHGFEKRALSCCMVQWPADGWAGYNVDQAELPMPCTKNPLFRGN